MRYEAFLQIFREIREGMEGKGVNGNLAHLRFSNLQFTILLNGNLEAPSLLPPKGEVTRSNPFIIDRML